MWIDDTVLKQASHAVSQNVWVPKSIYVVLGNANNLDTECFLDRCIKDKVTVLKRYGGGGTVVLHSGCIIVSLGMWVKDFFKNDIYFKRINKALISTLSKIDPKFKEFSQKGISDICCGDRKNIGTSLFRSRNYLLYQASIIFDTKIEIIERYLKHPSKEPKYRNQKSHKDFLVGISDLCPHLSQDHISHYLINHFSQEVCEHMEDERIMCKSEQLPTIMKRAHSGRGVFSFENNIDKTL